MDTAAYPIYSAAATGTAYASAAAQQAYAASFVFFASGAGQKLLETGSGLLTGFYSPGPLSVPTTWAEAAGSLANEAYDGELQKSREAAFDAMLDWFTSPDTQ